MIAAMAAATLVVAALYSRRHTGALQQARVLRRGGFVIMAFFVGISSALLVGEAFVDPGGVTAVAFVAGWLVPLVGLSVLAWRWPGPAIVVLAVLGAGAVAVDVAAALDVTRSPGIAPSGTSIGAVATLTTVVVGAALAVLGLHRPGWAGVLLVPLGVAPLATTLVASAGAESVIDPSLIGFPAIVTGMLYLLAALAVAPSRRPNPTGPADDSERQPS